MANTTRNNTFLLKRSNVPNKVPSGGQLLLGELAINTADVKLYASGTTSNSILPIGWDRISRTGDTMTGPLTIRSGSGTDILFSIKDSGGTQVASINASGTADFKNINISGFVVTGLTEGQVVFASSGGTLAGSSKLTWDNTNGRFGVNTTTSAGYNLDVNGIVRINNNNTYNDTTNSLVFAYPNATNWVGNADKGVLRITSTGRLIMTDRYDSSYFGAGLHVNRLYTNVNIGSGFYNYSGIAGVVGSTSKSTNATEIVDFEYFDYGIGVAGGTSNSNATRAAGVYGIAQYVSNGYTAATMAHTYGGYFVSGTKGGPLNSPTLKRWTGVYVNVNPSLTNDAASIGIGLDVNISGTYTKYAALFNGGNVGIGTSSPSQLLDVNGNVRFGTSTTGLTWDNTNGRLGIGTNSPTAKLYVKGGTSDTFKVESTTTNLWNQFISTDGTGEYGINNDAFYFQPLSTLSNGLVMLNGGNKIIFQMFQSGNITIQNESTYPTDPGYRLDVNGSGATVGILRANGSITASAGTATGINFTPTLIAAANGNTLTGLNISPTFSAITYTGLTTYGLRVNSGDINFENPSNITYGPTLRLLSNDTNSTVAKTTAIEMGSRVNGNNYIRIDVAGTGSYNQSPKIDFQFPVGSYPYTLQTNVSFRSSGNVLIGTTTDAGYRLDVNGTGAGTGALRVTGVGSTFDHNITINSISIGRGANNIASNLQFGAAALASITSGTFNIGIGESSLRSTTTGNRNISIGSGAIRYVTSGNDNIGIGVETIGDVSFNNSQNTAIGNYALRVNTGYNNTAIGYFSLRSNTTGYDNVAIGKNAGYNVGTDANTTGSNNIFIGANSIGTSITDNNKTWIGNSSTTQTWLGGNLALGQTSATALADLAGSTTSRSSLRIRSGTAPTTPNAGDIWFDGNDLYASISGVSKSLTAAGAAFGTGSTGQVTYWNSTSGVTGSNTFTYTPTTSLLVNNSITADSINTIIKGVNITSTLTAAQTGDILAGLYINPTFVPGANVVSNYSLYANGESLFNSSSLTSLTVQGSNSNWTGVRIKSTASGGRSYLLLASASNGTVGNSNFSILDENAGQPRLIINSSGYVGLMTASASYPLTLSNSTVNLGSLSSGGNLNAMALMGNGLYLGVQSTTNAIVFGMFSQQQSFIWAGWNGVNMKERMRLTQNENLLLGTTTDAGYRLDINGTGASTGGLRVTNGTTLLQGSANTSSTNALVVNNSDGNLLYAVRNTGNTYTSGEIRIGVDDTYHSIYQSAYLNLRTRSNFGIGGAATTAKLSFATNGNSSSYIQTQSDGSIYYFTTDGNTNGYHNGHLFKTNSQSANYVISISNEYAFNKTSGSVYGLQTPLIFQPSNGMATFAAAILNPTINQTGTASATTRGLYINPILSAATDWRSIEWSNNTGWGLYGDGTANNYLNGDLLIGTTTDAGYKLDVNGSGASSGALKVSNGTSLFSASSGSVVTVIGSGSSTSAPIFSVQGSSGELFSVTDSLTGSLFSVNDISGLPILEAFSDNTVLMGNYQAPSLNTTAKITAYSGSTTIYSIPTSAYTGAFFDYTVMSSAGARSGNIMAIFSGTSVQYTESSTNDIGDTSSITFSVGITGSTAYLVSSATTSPWTVKTIVRAI